MADLYRDFVFTRNTTTVASNDTAITVEDVSLFPSNVLLAKSDFFIAFESSLSYPHTFEICKLTNVNTSTKTLTVVRGQAGTTAQAHAIVTYIKGTLTSDMLRRARAGFFGTASAPALDQDLYLTGDRFYNQTEGRYFVYTNRAGLFGDTFTRAASATTMGNTETQTYTSLLGAAASVPYVGTWTTFFSGIWGINANGQAYYVSGAAGQTASMVGVGGTDFDISFDVFASATAGSDYGLLFRSDATGTYGYYLQFNGTTAALYRNNGGYVTTSQTTTYTTGVVHTWRITCVGNVITIYRDGTQVITYTEALASFTIASNTYLPGAYVGMRIGNATGFADTSLYWDNFLCAYPGNTAVNTPVPQGWAPASYTAAETTGWINLTKNLEIAQQSMANNVDDLTAAAAQIDSGLGGAELTLALVANQVDDLRDLIVDYDTRGIGADLTLALMAVQVDEILDTLVNSAVLTGIGDPGGTALPNAIYVDKYSKRIWAYLSGTWTALTYAGPNVAAGSLTERTARTANSATCLLPVGSAVGDLCIYSQVQRNGGPQYITPPSGFTTQAQGYGPYQYWSSWLVATKILTSADITAGQIVGSASSEDATVIRVFNSGAYDIAVAGPGNAGYPNMSQVGNSSSFSTPSATTTKANDVVISMWFSVGASLSAFTSPSVALSNVATLVGGTVAIYTGDEVAVAAGATPTRSITVNGSGLEVGSATFAVKLNAPTLVYPPMANPTVKTTTYTAQSGDLVLANAVGGAFTVSLATATSGTTILCKKTDVSTNAVTVVGTSGALIDGATSFSLANQYDSVTLIADGTNWQVV